MAGVNVLYNIPCRTPVISFYGKNAMEITEMLRLWFIEQVLFVVLSFGYWLFSVECVEKAYSSMDYTSLFFRN